MGKGEIAHHEQFLLFPQCFQKDLCCGKVKTRACLGKGKNSKVVGLLKHDDNRIACNPISIFSRYFSESYCFSRNNMTYYLSCILTSNKAE